MIVSTGIDVVLIGTGVMLIGFGVVLTEVSLVSLIETVCVGWGVIKTTRGPTAP